MRGRASPLRPVAAFDSGSLPLRNRGDCSASAQLGPKLDRSCQRSAGQTASRGERPGSPRPGEGLREGPRRRRRRPHRRRGRAGGAPRPERRRQDHHPAHAPRRHHPRRGLDHRGRPRPAQGPVPGDGAGGLRRRLPPAPRPAHACARRCRSSPASTAWAGRRARPPSTRASSASRSPTSPTACAWSCRRASARSSAS